MTDMPVYYDGQVIVNSVAYAALGNWIIQKVKESKLIPFVNEQTYWINKSLGVIVAAIGVLGINYTYNYSSDGILAITISGLTATSVWNSFIQWLFQYVTQQGIYTGQKWKEEKDK